MEGVCYAKVGLFSCSGFVGNKPLLGAVGGAAGNAAAAARRSASRITANVVQRADGRTQHRSPRESLAVSLFAGPVVVLDARQSMVVFQRPALDHSGRDEVQRTTSRSGIVEIGSERGGARPQEVVERPRRIGWRRTADEWNARYGRRQSERLVHRSRRHAQRRQHDHRLVLWLWRTHRCAGSPRTMTRGLGVQEGVSWGKWACQC